MTATIIVAICCLVIASVNASVHGLSTLYAAGIILPSFTAGILTMRAIVDHWLPY